MRANYKIIEVFDMARDSKKNIEKREKMKNKKYKKSLTAKQRQ